MKGKTLAKRIKSLHPVCPFDLKEFFVNNIDLVEKYLQKNTYELNVPDFDDVPDDWFYMGQDGILRDGVSKGHLYTDLHKLEWLKCALDVVYFTKKYVKIISVDYGIIPFELYDFQEDLLSLYQEERFVVSMQARQTGKCVHENANINVRNKRTGELRSITIGEFHELQRKESESH
jgi:hypothetical protein